MVLHLTWQGYSVEWTDNGTVLACHTPSAEKKSREPPWAKPIAAGVSSASFTAMVGIALMVRLKMTGQLRRKWQREKELDKNRQKGVPTEGLVTIVVTDVERYSGRSVGRWGISHAGDQVRHQWPSRNDHAWWDRHSALHCSARGLATSSPPVMSFFMCTLEWCAMLLSKRMNCQLPVSVYHAESPHCGGWVYVECACRDDAA